MSAEIDMEAYQKELMNHLMLLQQQQAASGTAADDDDDGKAATPTGKEPLTCSGCQNATVQVIIKGDYTWMSENHGKPVYRKAELHENEPVLIYFWDERDGEAFSGWWFGPKVGGDQVWAYNPGKDGAPPMGGWKVPYAGPIDPSLQITVTGSSNKRSAEGFDQEQIAKMAKTATQDMASVYQAAVAEQQAMQQASLQEQQAAQQKATSTALELRKIIQKVRMATPENFADLKQELQEALQKDLVNCGAHMSRIKEEAQQVVDQMQAAVQAKLALQAAEEEKRRQEEDARKLEEQKEEDRKARTAELLREQGEKVLQAENATEDAEKVTKEFITAATEEEMTKVSERVLQACSTALSTCQAAVDFAFETKFEAEAAKSILGPTRVEAAGFQKRIAEAQQKVESIVQEAKKSKDKWQRKAKVLKFNDAMDAVFKKYDKDSDGLLSRSEVQAFAKGEFNDFEIESATLDKVLARIDPDKKGKVPKDMFHRLRTLIGMEFEVLMTVERKVEAEKMNKVKEEQKAAMAPKLKAAVTAMAAAEKAGREAEQKAGRAAGWKRPNRDENLLDLAKAAVEATNKAQELLEEAKAANDVLGAEDIIDEGYRKTIQTQHQKLAHRCRDLQPKLSQHLGVATKAKEHQEKLAEQSKQKRKEGAKNQCISFWKILAKEEEKNVHDYVKDALGDISDMDEPEWIKFFEKLQEMKPEGCKARAPNAESLKMAFELLAVTVDENLVKVATDDLLKLVPAPPPPEPEGEKQPEKPGLVSAAGKLVGGMLDKMMGKKAEESKDESTEAPEAEKADAEMADAEKAEAPAEKDDSTKADAEADKEEKASAEAAKEEKADTEAAKEKNGDAEAEKDGKTEDKMEVDS